MSILDVSPILCTLTQKVTLLSLLLHKHAVHKIQMVTLAYEKSREVTRAECWQLWWTVPMQMIMAGGEGPTRTGLLLLLGKKKSKRKTKQACMISPATIQWKPLSFFCCCCHYRHRCRHRRLSSNVMSHLPWVVMRKAFLSHSVFQSVKSPNLLMDFIAQKTQPTGRRGALLPGKMVVCVIHFLSVTIITRFPLFLSTRLAFLVSIATAVVAASRANTTQI